MKNRMLLPLVVGIICSSCQDTKVKTNDRITNVLQTEKNVVTMPTKVIFDDNIKFNQEQKDIIVSTIQGYNNFFQCGIKEITISRKDLDTSSTESDVWHVEYHHIFLTNDDWLNENNERLKNTIIHEFFHTIKPDTVTLSRDNYVLPDGYRITWYRWLSIKVQKWRDTTQFGVIEDAGAEACAFTYKNNYQVPNPHYANGGSLMLKMIHNWWITAEDIIQYQQTNNISAFCKKILNKKISPQNIGFLMQMFNMVYATQEDLTDKALKEISNIRDK